MGFRWCNTIQRGRKNSRRLNNGCLWHRHILAVSSSLIGSGGIVNTALDAPQVWLDGQKAWVPLPMLGISLDISWYKGNPFCV